MASMSAILGSTAGVAGPSAAAGAAAGSGWPGPGAFGAAAASAATAERAAPRVTAGEALSEEEELARGIWMSEHWRAEVAHHRNMGAGGWREREREEVRLVEQAAIFDK